MALIMEESGFQIIYLLTFETYTSGIYYLLTLAVEFASLKIWSSEQ